MSETITLDDPVRRKMSLGGERTAQPLGDARFLPAGHELVSADDHWEVTTDIFYEQLPDHLKEIGPRVWRESGDRMWSMAPRTADKHVSIRGRGGPVVAEFINNSAHWDGYDRAVRARDLAAEGIKKSIVFPNFVMGLVHHPNLELREEIYRVYNRYIAQESREQQGFYGVAVCHNWWEAGKAESIIQEIVDLGLKAVMLPYSLRLPDSPNISFADQRLERFWGALEQSGLPLVLHVGEGFPGGDQRGLLGVVLNQLDPFRMPLGQMIFGGVFDRYPGLRVVFAEAGFSWVAAFLQDAEMFFDCHGKLEPIKQRPSYYWHTNCYATFMTDQLGLTRLLDIVGADRVMWGSDYPHAEGTFGFTRDTLKQIAESTTELQARLILGDTARKVFRI